MVAITDKSKKDWFIEFLKPMSTAWSALSGWSMAVGFFAVFAWLGTGVMQALILAAVSFAASAAFQGWASAHLVVINRAEDRERWDRLQTAVAEKAASEVRA